MKPETLALAPCLRGLKNLFLTHILRETPRFKNELQTPSPDLLPLTLPSFSSPTTCPAPSHLPRPGVFVGQENTRRPQLPSLTAGFLQTP